MPERTTVGTDKDQSQRTLEHQQMVAEIFNSLIRRGELVRTGDPKLPWMIVPGSGLNPGNFPGSGGGGSGDGDEAGTIIIAGQPGRDGVSPPVIPGNDGEAGDDAWPMPGTQGAPGVSIVGPPGNDGEDGESTWQIIQQAAVVNQPGLMGIPGQDGEDGGNSVIMIGGSTGTDGAFALTGDITPTALSADVNDYNPTGLSTATVLRLSSDASRTITGIAGGADGRILIIHNVGSNNILFTNDDINSTAANRFYLTTTVVTLVAYGTLIFRYDATFSRWIIFTTEGLAAGCSVYGNANPSLATRNDIELAESEILARISNVVDGYTLDDFTADDIAVADNMIFADASASNETNSITVQRLLGFALRYIVNGRLTLTTALPVTTSDVTAAGTIYFTPFKGDVVALYDGTRWKLYTFTEVSLALTVTSGSNYDVFLYDNSGTLTLELSAAWTNDTTRADALTTQNGILVKSGATTRRYLGTIRASGSNTTEDSFSRRFVWNYYNRRRRVLRCTDTTDTWNYTTATWRSANASTTVGTARVEILIGWSEDPVLATVYSPVTTTDNKKLSAGVGIDSTSANSAYLIGGGCAASGVGPNVCFYEAYPGIGYHFVQRLEISDASGTTTWYGDGGVTYIQSGMVVEVLA